MNNNEFLNKIKNNWWLDLIAVSNIFIYFFVAGRRTLIGVFKLPVAFFILILTMLNSSSAMAATDITISSYILPTPCDLSMDTSTLDFGSLDSATISKGSWSQSEVKVFKIILSGCGDAAGAPAGAFTPTLSIKGDSMATPGVIPVSAVYNEFLIRGVDSTSLGFGFMARFNDNTVSKPNGGTPLNMGMVSCPTITPVKNACNATLPALPASGASLPIPVAVAVTNGENPKSSLKAGTLNASLIFTLDYK